jgi:hypothetical protein
MAGRIIHEHPEHHVNGRLFGGLALIVVGLLVLLANTTQSEVLGLMFLPGLGIALLAYGLYTREYGFVVPGSIVTGLGLGILLAVNVLTLEGTGTAGVILLGLASGFLAISVFSPYVGQPFFSWPIIPAGIIGLIGMMLLVGGVMLDVLAFVGNIRPLFLVAAGLIVIFWPRRTAS